MKRVYVAGAYSADNVIQVLDNMRKGMRVATEIFLMGHAPLVPWFDFHFQLMLREGESLSVEDYYQYSIKWLEVSDAMVVVEGFEESKGTLKEIKIAKSMGMPIFYTAKSLDGYWKFP